MIFGVRRTDSSRNPENPSIPFSCRDPTYSESKTSSESMVLLGRYSSILPPSKNPYNFGPRPLSEKIAKLTVSTNTWPMCWRWILMRNGFAEVEEVTWNRKFDWPLLKQRQFYWKILGWHSRELLDVHLFLLHILPFSTQIIGSEMTCLLANHIGFRTVLRE